MIYVENDFYSNFQGAVNSDDDIALVDMFIDQLSTLIAKNRGEVLSLYQKSGILTSNNPSNEEIVNALIQNIKTNVKLRAGLSFLIAKNNELLASSKKGERENDNKDPKGNPKNVNWEKSADTVTYIANSLNNLIEDLNPESLNKFKKQLKIKSNVKAPNYSSQSYSNVDGNNDTGKKKKKRTWVWVLVGVAVAGGIYYAYKKGMFKKKTNLESGGSVENVEL